MVFTCARTSSRPSAVRFDINFLLEGPCAVVVESQQDCDLISKVNPLPTNILEIGPCPEAFLLLALSL